MRSPLRMLICGILTLLAVGSGLAAERTAWTTSRVVGSPDPPLPFRTERVFPQLNFEQITLLAFAPGNERLFVGERPGKLWSFALAADVSTKELVIDLPKALSIPAGQSFDSLYGLAFDPQFAQNRLVYLCYVLKGTRSAVLQGGSRVSRFRLTNTDPPTLDPASESILLTYRAGGHNGGCLEFGPDGMLYISTGDASGPNPPDSLKTGQDCSDLLSSILRIDVHPRDSSRPYATPADNPFVGRAGLRDEIWAYGLRNPWKMSFDRKTGELWVADVGWDLWEMVHWVTKGANFGWGAYEGRQPVRADVEAGPTPMIPPLIELPHTIAASVTGGYVYRGSRFPELQGEYIFGDWETKRVWAAHRDERGQGVLRDLADSGLQISAFGEDAAGELYLADYGQGILHTLIRNERVGQPLAFPRRLSETGLFREVTTQTPEAGVLPFEINQPQWSDFATAERWIAMPGTQPIVWHPADRPIPGSMFQRQHDYPTGTVLAKTLSLALRQNDPQSSRKIETQLLHFDGRDWQAYCYAWNDDQTDAELVPGDGAERTFLVDDARWSGGKRVQRWSFAGRKQCLSCHSPWAQQALAFTPAQLHRPIEREGQTVNQLLWLEAHGVFSRVDNQQRPLASFTDETLSKTPRLARRDDAHASIKDQIRSYLHVNCSHCHRFNGGGAGSFELLLKHSDLDLKVIDELPRQGTFDVPDARLIARGEPDRSLLYLRMAKHGRGRMPHLGSEFVDETAVAWLEHWIHNLGDRSDAPPPTPWTTALRTARKIGRAELPAAERDAVLQAALTNPSPLMQDLFSGFQPADHRPQTLGSAIRPDAILSQPGDAQRGERLFWKTSTVSCKQCHKVDQHGGDIGPELREAVKKRTTAELVDSLLDPSKVVEPKYRTHVAQTLQGRTHSGLLIQQDDRQVTLRDSQGRDTTLLRAEIEELQASPKSLMPDQLLRDLTAQEAADLLAYLVSLKTPAP